MMIYVRLKCVLNRDVIVILVGPLHRRLITCCLKHGSAPAQRVFYCGACVPAPRQLLRFMVINYCSLWDSALWRCLMPVSCIQERLWSFITCKTFERWWRRSGNPLMCLMLFMRTHIRWCS